jgi:hypothetical protein
MEITNPNYNSSERLVRRDPNNPAKIEFLKQHPRYPQDSGRDLLVHKDQGYYINGEKKRAKGAARFIRDNPHSLEFIFISTEVKQELERLMKNKKPQGLQPHI